MAPISQCILLRGKPVETLYQRHLHLITSAPIIGPLKERKNIMALSAKNLRVLSQADQARLEAAYITLHSLLRDYVITDENLQEKPNFGKKQTVKVAERMTMAFEVIRLSKMQAALAALSPKVRDAIAPHVAIASDMRSKALAMVDQAPAFADLLRKSGALQDDARVPVIALLTAFDPGTTVETAVSRLKDLGYTVAATRGRNSSWDVVVSLVEKVGPKNPDQVIREARQAAENHSADESPASQAAE